MTTLDILRGKQTCLIAQAHLEPVGGLKRFQPAGFPEIGPVLYDDPSGSNGRICIVDSAASMANHLETVSLGGGESIALHEDLAGLPYVLCETQDHGERREVCTTFTEGHRLASDYFLKATVSGQNFRDLLRERMKVKELTKDKRYFFYPDNWGDIYKTVFRYDPNSLVHGLMFARDGIKISRVLTAHHEAHGAERVLSSGVKFDQLGVTLSGQPIFSVEQETAEKIVATFIIDLGLLRSYGRENNGLTENDKRLLLELCLWKIEQLTDRAFRFRSGCYLKRKGELAWSDERDAAVATPKAAIRERIAECRERLGDSPTRVLLPVEELYRAATESAKEKTNKKLKGKQDDAELVGAGTNSNEE